MPPLVVVELAAALLLPQCIDAKTTEEQAMQSLLLLRLKKKKVRPLQPVAGAEATAATATACGSVAAGFTTTGASGSAGE